MLDEINWERNSMINTPKAGVLTRSNGGKRIEGRHSNQRSEMILRNRYVPNIIIFQNRITPSWNALPLE